MYTQQVYNRNKCSETTLSRTAEDYLRIMYTLEKRYGRIRVKDIAIHLGVRPSSVIDYLKRLSQEGLIEYKPGSRIKFTEEGRRKAEEIYSRHNVIKELLILIGVPPDIAEKDACNMEHGLHKETLEKIVSFIKHCRRRMNKDQERPARSQPL